jgi:hypothetical protein
MCPSQCRVHTFHLPNTTTKFIPDCIPAKISVGANTEYQTSMKVFWKVQNTSTCQVQEKKKPHIRTLWYAQK